MYQQKVTRSFTVTITNLEVAESPIKNRNTVCEQPYGYSLEPTEAALTKLIAERFADVTAIKVEEYASQSL